MRHGDSPAHLRPIPAVTPAASSAALQSLSCSGPPWAFSLIAFMSSSTLTCMRWVQSFGSGQVSTIDSEGRAGNEAGFRASEVSDQARDLAISSEPPERHQGAKPGTDLLTGVHVGFRRTGLNRIYCDTARTQVTVEPARHRGDRALGHRIDRRPWKARTVGGDATRGDDPAALTHGRNNRLNGEDRNTVVQGKRADLGGRRAIIHDAADENSGIVDKNVEAPEAVDGFVHGAL